MKTRLDRIQREIALLGEDSDRDVIYGAMQGLNQLGTAAVAPLIAVLQDPTARCIVRCRVADTLAMMGDRRAIAPLLAVLTEAGEVQLRWSAAVALAQIGDVSALAALRRAAETDEGSFDIIPGLHKVMREEIVAAIRSIEAREQRNHE